MKVIVCIDDGLGMMFNKRRQSRDRVLCADVVRDLGGETLAITPYSLLLFEATGAKLSVSDAPFATDAKVAFIENLPLLVHKDEICEMVVYRWNRRYPADVHLDLLPWEHGFVLKESSEFVGSSHEKITKEVYAR